MEWILKQKKEYKLSKVRGRTRRGARPGRSLNKLIWVIPEGRVTEYEYFRTVKRKLNSKDSGISVEVARNPRGGAAGNLVSIAEKTESKIIKNREFEIWIVLDDDRRTDKNKLFVWYRGDKNKRKLAVTNPMFEFWLLLHFGCKKVLMSKSKYGDQLGKEISKAIGRPYKFESKLEEDFITYNRIKNACVLAKGQEVSSLSNWPKLGSTNVDLLLKRILKIK